MGEDYNSQSRSEFNWYNPHLYNYYRTSNEDLVFIAFQQI